MEDMIYLWDARLASQRHITTVRAHTETEARFMVYRTLKAIPDLFRVLNAWMDGGQIVVKRTHPFRVTE